MPDVPIPPESQVLLDDLELGSSPPEALVQQAEHRTGDLMRKLRSKFPDLDRLGCAGEQRAYRDPLAEQQRAKLAMEEAWAAYQASMNHYDEVYISGDDCLDLVDDYEAFKRCYALWRVAVAIADSLVMASKFTFDISWGYYQAAIAATGERQVAWVACVLGQFHIPPPPLSPSEHLAVNRRAVQGSRLLREQISQRPGQA
jgi:hypothetical protein